MNILKQSLLFDEALRDSPFFKAYLKGYGERIAAFEKNVFTIRSACDDLSRIQTLINTFRLSFTSSFKSMSDDLIADRTLKNAVDVLNSLIETLCNSMFTLLQEMRDHVLESMADIYKMQLKRIEDQQKNYSSYFDFFESHLMKSVTSSALSTGALGSAFNDNHKQQSHGMSSDSAANSRIVFKRSAVEVAKVINIFRIEFREQILHAFPRLVKCVNNFSDKMFDKTRQIVPDVEAVTALISRALMEYREDREYVMHRYEQARKKCALPPTIEDSGGFGGGGGGGMMGSPSVPSMSIAPPLPYLTSCNIIILQGYLLKQPHTKFGPWSRRWFYLVDDRLLYYRTNEGLLPLSGKKESDFKIVTESLNKSWLIRNKKDDRKHILELQGPADQYSSSSSHGNQGSASGSSKHTSMLLQAESRAEGSLWQDVIFATIQNSASNSPAPRDADNSSSAASELVLVDTIIKPEFSYTSPIEEFSRFEENKYCCDCGGLDPSWGVTPFGITVCSSCAQVHRTLITTPNVGGGGAGGKGGKIANGSAPDTGDNRRSATVVPSVSSRPDSCLQRVLNLTLDEWRPEVAALMKLLGNKFANSIYEAHRTNELEKPSFDSDMPTREKWIVGKYVERRFVRQLSDAQSFDPSQKLFSVVNSESCDVGLILQYISQGADVNWKNPNCDYRTSLHNATFGGKLTCCELLIQQGADINSLDGLGRTPLHYACVNSNRMVACLLLNHGADPHALDSEEKTPMDVATEAQDRELLCVLKISQALRKFQPIEVDTSRFASSSMSARLSRMPTRNKVTLHHTSSGHIL
ncbi:arf-GAP with coiled-coil, ANK repeat and PH domain-containing protein 2-like isoform X2 [Convolutriloba macropyga]|uniref:arf-GAP with coiled-coil, ANK repeat and PH domain-containing protein 2-like isoform X2 n=1 Tax=Convolutriloba macropyga TaxID=536237 RepID=UPI003F527A27